jgi:hypothetical protein
MGETVSRPPDAGSSDRDPHAKHRRALPAGTPPYIGRCEVLRVLGAGAFGRVYLAFDPGPERYVAIKTPKEPLPPESQNTFLHEARAIANIHHPNVCPIYAADVQDGLPYIVMRFVSGGTLSDLIENKPPSPLEALAFAAQIARGLEAAHTAHRKVIHRDLKPANILHDDESGDLLLTDFGLARLLEQSSATSGAVKGTPVYMAPEQWDTGPNGRFGPVSPRTDVYALGVMLFRFLTGVPLFVGTIFELMLQHYESVPRRPSEVRPGLDPHLDDLVLKALKKQPAERYQSAKEFAAAIAQAARDITPKPQSQAAPPAARVQVGVRGTWSARPVAKPDANWRDVTPTPAEVATRPDEVYQLRLTSDIRDDELANLAPLKALTALESLDFPSCTQVTDAGLYYVQSLTALRTLHLSGCKQVTDAGLYYLQPLTALQSLNLRDCTQFTGTGLGHLTRHTALQALNLSWCAQFTDAGLYYAKALTGLHTINLGGCKQITDVGLQHLRALAGLRTLSLFRCELITDAGLQHLRWLPGLQTLHLSGCPRVTSAGIADLKRALPNCTISS